MIKQEEELNKPYLQSKQLNNLTDKSFKKVNTKNHCKM